ncbi:MAG: SDR family oxidoreductase [Gammaproteobacteria bacterium]
MTSVSAFLLSRAVFPHLREGDGGCIINFSRAGRPQANMVAYNRQSGDRSADPHAGLEGRDTKIRGNAVAPGLVDAASNIAAMKPKDLTKWARREDIAQSVLFLASDAAAGITGQILPVAGWGI